PQAPFIKLALLEANQPVVLEGLRITPVEVNHVVPTFAFLVEEGPKAVVIATDTGPTEEVWRRANGLAGVGGVFLEATFPNGMQWLADVSKHLTPQTFAAELRKLARAVPVYVVHIKARFHDEVVRELQALKLPHVQVAQYGHPYNF